MTGPLHWLSQLASMTKFSLLTMPGARAPPPPPRSASRRGGVLVGTLSIAQASGRPSLCRANRTWPWCSQRL